MYYLFEFYILQTDKCHYFLENWKNYLKELKKKSVPNDLYVERDD